MNENAKTNIFKDEEHEEQTALFLEKFKKNGLLQNREYGSFAYIAGATYKFKQIEKAVDVDGIDTEQLLEIIAPFSPSEKAMIRFGLQCFNNNFDDIPLDEVMWSLDRENKEVIKQAINIRY